MSFLLLFLNTDLQIFLCEGSAGILDSDRISFVGLHMLEFYLAIIETQRKNFNFLVL